MVVVPKHSGIWFKIHGSGTKMIVDELKYKDTFLMNILQASIHYHLKSVCYWD